MLLAGLHTPQFPKILLCCAEDCSQIDVSGMACSCTGLEALARPCRAGPQGLYGTCFIVKNLDHSQSLLVLSAHVCLCLAMKGLLMPYSSASPL